MRGEVALYKRADLRYHSHEVIFDDGTAFHSARILSLLDREGIPYELYEHDRAYTIDDCLRMPFIGPGCDHVQKHPAVQPPADPFLPDASKAAHALSHRRGEQGAGRFASELCPRGGPGGASAPLPAEA